VARGFLWKEGQDYIKVFAHVARETISDTILFRKEYNHFLIWILKRHDMN